MSHALRPWRRLGRWRGDLPTYDHGLRQEVIAETRKGLARLTAFLDDQMIRPDTNQAAGVQALTGIPASPDSLRGGKHRCQQPNTRNSLSEHGGPR